MKSIIYGLSLVTIVSCSPNSQKVTRESDLTELLKITTVKDMYESRKDFSEPSTDLLKKKLAAEDEQNFLKFERTVLEKWKTSFLNKDVTDFSKFFVTNAKMSLIDSMELNRNFDGIEEYSWKTTNTSTDIKNTLEAYLTKFNKVESFELVTTSMRSNSVEMRNDTNNAIIRAELSMNYDLRGFGKNNERIHDRSKMIVEISNTSGNWYIEAVEMVNGETLIAKDTLFESSTDKLGLNELKVYPRREAIRRGGYALAVNDINNDGELDLYVGNSATSQLVLGKKNGKDLKFEIQPDTPFTNDTLVKSVAFADYDNDGNKDLLTVRFDQAVKDQDRQEDVRFYKGLGDGKFEFQKVLQNTNRKNYAMPAAIADFNQDGFLDIYIGFPGAQDFTFFSNQRLSNHASVAQGLYINDKNGKYTDETASLYKRDDTHMCCDLFPHSAQAVDYNLDGKSDLLVIDDAGGLSHLYKNNGDAKFSQIVGKTDPKLNDYGMSVTAGDAFNTGTVDILFSSVNFHAARRINNSYKINYAKTTRGNQFTGNGYTGLKFYKGFKNKDNSIKYLDMTEILGLEDAGEGLASAEFIDYNNDGLLDIYVTNGLWSGDNKEKENDLSSLFVRSELFLADILQDLKSIGSPYLDYKQEERSQSFFMDILTNFKGDVLTGKNDDSGKSPSFAGHQRNRLYRNNGDNSFTEVGFLAGVDSTQDGYIIATADLNKDGKMDLILRNSDPAFVDSNSRPVEVFTNNSKNNNSVLLTLEGVKTNKDAIGVIAKAKVGKKELIRQLVGNNGSAQSQLVLHFGLGESKQIDSLELRWPSGITQVLKNVKPGHHFIKEEVKEKNTNLTMSN